MTQNNYIAFITVTATAEEAYAALTTGFDKWWTTPEGHFENIGDRVKFTFPPQASFWTFEAISLEPRREVRMKCVEACHIILDKPESSKTEWLDSTANWFIEEGEEGTMITFEHDGLFPGLACFEVCEAGWNHFFVNSLKDYLTTGTGTPHQA